MRHLYGLVLFGALLSTIACGGSKDSGGGGNGGGSGGAGGGAPGPTAEQACTDSAKSACDKYDTCSNGFLIGLVFGDLDTCVSVRKDLCMTSLDAPDTGSTPATKEACAKETPKETCTDFIDVNDVGACITPAGTLEDGAACGAWAQCKSAFCAVPDGASCGKCASLPKVGDACTSYQQCGSGQVCNTGTGRCQVPVAEGGACSNDAICDTFLGCDVGGSGLGNGTCKALPAKMGAACDPNLGCDALRGFLCYPPDNKCGAIALADPGQTCGLVSPTSYALCSHNAICEMGSGDPTGTCVVPVDEGKACDTNFGPSCVTGLTCVGTDGTGKCQKFDPASCH